MTSPAGIDCGGTCSKTFDFGTKVSLIATPDAGSVFKAWSGACAGQGATCNLTIQGATSTNAVFELPTAGGGTTGGGTTGGGPAGSDTAVEVDVIGAKGGHSRIGKRIVQLELNLDENVSANLKLVRGGKTLASKQIGKVKEGDRLLVLLVPGGVAKGRATLQFELKATRCRQSVL